MSLDSDVLNRVFEVFKRIAFPQKNPNAISLLLGIFFLLPVYSFADAPSNEASSYWQRVAEIRSDNAYSNSVERGSFKRDHTIVGHEESFHFSVHVPESYSPKDPMPLHIYLHGGVGFSGKKISVNAKNNLKRLRIDNTISVYPSAWKSAKWWHEVQPKNILKIIKELKSEYNIDDNRVFIHGVSDGASGTYYYASHIPTPFAGFVALIGSPRVLSDKNNTYGTTFIPNFINKPIFALNTKKDHLFPSSSVKSFFERVNTLGGDVRFHSVSGKHDMNWLNKKKKDIQAFVSDQRRNPYPDKLRWQIDAGQEFPRIHWLVLNTPIDADKPSIAEVNKQGNIVYLSSINISTVSLLISPDHFDLNREIQIWANKTLVFNQRISPDVNTLNKWYEIDKDKSMLFSNEIHIELN
jgi:dienelactone hydrolase